VSKLTEQAADQARFFAREFVAHWEHEMGSALPAIVRYRMMFAAEVGYLRGHGEGMLASGALYDDVRKKEIDESE
jgi:hypothetical protein